MNCSYCKRPLTDPTSISLGYGPVCGARDGRSHPSVSKLKLVTYQAWLTDKQRVIVLEDPGAVRVVKSLYGEKLYDRLHARVQKRWRSLLSNLVTTWWVDIRKEGDTVSNRVELKPMGMLTPEKAEGMRVVKQLQRAYR